MTIGVVAQLSISRAVFVTSSLLILTIGPAGAFDDIDTHPRITRASIRGSSLDASLKNELAMGEGVLTVLRPRSGNGQSIQRWIEDGSRLEDNPTCRATNHFHNPLKPFTSSGLEDEGFLVKFGCGSGPGLSSVTWGTRFTSPTDRGSEATGNTFDWDAARTTYLGGLTLAKPSDSEAALAQTFETLGHVMHLVEDLAVPAHARNDFQSHLEFCIPRRTPPPRWCESGFERFVRLNPELVDNALGESIGFAGQQVTRFWDVDQYNGTNPSADVIQGLAEYTNANFASQFTIFTESRPLSDHHRFPYPRESSTNIADLFPHRIVLEPVRAKDAKVDRALYIEKTGDGETIKHFAKVGYLWSDLVSMSPAIPVSLVLQLDDEVNKDYADLLLPKAVGYARGLLDYFFRGKLDVDLVQDPQDRSLLRLTGTNASADTLVDGTLTLYWDDPDGVRGQVQAFGSVTIKDVSPGGALSSASFSPPETERFVAVYEGTLGQEVKDPARGFPGGVIGKVLGGVRVEEVFADGEEWKVRTPKGVFRLEPPLRVAEYEQVKWGDGPNLLVARTAFGPGQPNRVDGFEVPRVPNSIDLATMDTPDGPTVPVTRARSAVLPGEGISAGTRVNFHQTWSYRQQMVRVQEITVTVACQGGKAVGPATVTATPPRLETLATASADFPLTFPIVLDAHHYFSNFPPNYAWQLVDVGADPSGRLVGLVLVFGTFPDIPTVPITRYVLNRATGDKMEYAQSFLFASYPQGGDPLLWALVNFSDGRVITSTAEPTVSIRYQKRSEGSPLVWPDGQVGVAAHTTLVSCETTDLGWRITRVDQRSLPPGTVPVVTTRVDERVGDEGLILTGLLRGDLRSALAEAGFVDSQVATIERAESVIYVCLQADPVGDCQAVEVDARFNGVSRNPAFLEDARRPSAATGGARLVLLAKDYTAAEIPLAAVVVTEADPLRSQVRYQPRVDFAKLSSVTSTLALVTEEDFTAFAVSTTLAWLDGSRPPTSFPGVDLSGSFRVLDPSYLYNVNDMKFYRLVPTLQRTAFPAKLFELADNPIGEYHAIRVP